MQGRVYVLSKCHANFYSYIINFVDPDGERGTKQDFSRYSMSRNSYVIFTDAVVIPSGGKMQICVRSANSPLLPCTLKDERDHTKGNTLNGSRVITQVCGAFAPF